MQNFNKTFAEYSEEDFSEYSNNIFISMRKTNREYNALCKKRKDIKIKYPKILYLLDESKVLNITKLKKEEVYALRQYLEITDEIHYMEFQEMFRVGKKEEYCELKKLGILK